MDGEQSRLAAAQVLVTGPPEIVKALVVFLPRVTGLSVLVLESDVFNGLNEVLRTLGFWFRRLRC